MSKIKAKLSRITLDKIKEETPNIDCETCHRKEWLTIDHIIPVQILRDMGLSEEGMYSDRELIRVLCRACNSLKKNRLDFSDPRTKRLLLKLLERF